MLSYLKITILCLGCVAIIVLYGMFRCNSPSFKDPLTFSLFPSPFDNFLDGWGLSHFLFFMLLGYWFPTIELVIFSWILGVLWEVIEYSIKERPFYLSRCNYKLKSRNGGDWWYGRWQDIVMNTLGLLAGWILAGHLNRHQISISAKL